MKLRNSFSIHHHIWAVDALTFHCSQKHGVSHRFHPFVSTAMSCPANMVYTDCYEECPRSCSSLTTLLPKCVSSCVPGCDCAPGYVREGNACVKPEDCPCRYKNELFPSGSTMPVDCNEWWVEFGMYTPPVFAPLLREVPWVFIIWIYRTRPFACEQFVVVYTFR